MLKVLWIAYQPIPQILNNISKTPAPVTGGWLEGGARTIAAHDDIELYYCCQYPIIKEGATEGIYFYTTYKIEDLRKKDQIEIRKKDLERFKYILSEVNPDIIHIYGTETRFQRQYIYMAERLGVLHKTVCWIQGLTTFCAEFYTSGLTNKESKRKTIWEFFRGTNIEGIRSRLEFNGVEEIHAIGILKHTFVRTDWDSAACKAFNSKINMFFCNESLRPVFYENKLWNIKEIESHSIFISQYSTPIKGMHMLLKAFEIVVKEFPDAQIYTTGRDLFQKQSFIESIREASYLKIIRDSIEDKKLKDNIHFLGTLNGEEMRDRYIKSHVFVSASFIENSPNSLGEAMILGVPVVASDVGGVGSMLEHKREGLLYPFNDYTTMAEYICRIFRDDLMACRFSKAARERALITHDIENNYRNMLESYKQICNIYKK